MHKKSRTNEAYESVKQAILNGEYLPGHKLRIEQVAQVLSVSPGAIREALARLTSDALVVAEPQKGFIVAPISTDDLVDVTAVRIEIECRCLRRSIFLGDLAWEGLVLSSHHQMNKTPFFIDPNNPTSGTAPDWGKAHVKFHDAIVAACDSVWWLRLRDQLFYQSERYRRLTVPYAKIDRDVDSEHQSILDACLARDADKAVKRLTDHMQLTADILLASDAPFDDLPKPLKKKSKSTQYDT